MPSRQELSLTLAKARQELQQAQIRVAALEAQLFPDQPHPIELMAMENAYHYALDALPAGCQIIDFDWRYRYINDAATRYERRTKEELLGYTMMERHPGIEQTPVFAVLQGCMRERSVARIENEVRYPEGDSAWFELLIQPVPEGIFMLSLDITERKQRELAWLAREQQFRLFVEHAPAALAMLDSDMRYLLVSRRWLTDYRLSEINVIGRSHYDLFPDLPEQWKEIHQRCLAGAVEYSDADPFRRANGSLDWVRWEIRPWQKIDGDIGGLWILSEIITERKHAEEHIRKLHRTLGVLSDINQSIVRIRHLPALFEKACEIAVEKGTFRMAWLGLLNAKTDRIDPVAHAGIANNDLENLMTTLNTEPLSNVLRAGERLICNDIQNDPRWRLWHEEALRGEYKATVALPLIVAGEIRGIFNLYAGEIDFFDEQEMRLMDEMATDISFAIEFAEQDEKRLNAEAAVQRYAKRMEILHQIDRGIINANSTQEIMEAALKHIRQLIPCQRANVGLIDRAKGEGIIFAVDYEGKTALTQGLRVPIREDFFEGYDARYVKVVPDLRVLQETNPHFKQAVKEGLRSGLNVILRERDQSIGTLGLFANTPNFFTAEHQEIVIEVGNQLAIAIRQMQLSEELAQYTSMLEQRVAERTADLQTTLVRVEAILTNSPDSILLVYSDLTIQQTNSSFDRLFGSAQDAYLGESLLTLFHPDDANNTRDFFHLSATQQSGRRMEIRAIRKDDTAFDAELTIGVIKDDGLVCIIRDITERKAQERQLRYHAALQENVSDAVIVTDMALRIQSWNEAAVRTYGWTAEEAVGKVAPDFLYIRFLVLPPPEAMLKQFDEQGSLQQETLQRRKDGTDIFILGSVTRLDDEKGVPFGIVAINRDITERKAQERQLRYHASIQESVSDAVIATDMQFHIQSWNRAAETIYGWSAAEMMGKTVSEILQTTYASPEERTRILQDFFERGAWQGEVTQRHRDGRIRYIHASANLFKDEMGQPFGVVSVNRDITERKQAEVALRESEEKFRLLLDAAPVATIISDQTGRISLVNMQAENLLGYSRDELTGQLVELLVPDYAYYSHGNHRLTYVTAPRVRPMGSGMALYAKRKDGSEVPVEIELSYVETRDGIMVMSFIMDITERKRVAAELEQQRAFLRNVIDVSPNMIYVKDYEGRFVLVNPPVAAIYNTTIDALIGKTDADLNPNQKGVDNYLAADRLVITSGNMLFAEEPITSPTGKVHWLQTTKVPIVSADGQSKYVLGVSTDITERKEAEDALRASEEKYRSLVETMRGGLAVFDTEFRLMFVNDRFCELLGYSREEIIGKQAWNFVDFVDAADMPLIQSYRKRRQNAESTSYELPLRHKDGHQLHVLLSGSPLLDKEGKFNGSIVVATDISIQKQAEEALRLALAKEKELGDLKTRFISMASHEFRTPLATILALVETLSAYRHRLSEEQIEQRFNKIRGQVDHLKDIMEDVLLLARMQERRVEFNPIKLDLDDLSRDVLDEFEGRADVGQRLEYTVSGTSREILLDHKLMRQIISNLVSNAIKYSSEDKIVRIHLEYTDADIILKVSDEGIGIPEADLPHLFKPFHRAANVGTISGTGLGLVITREAVELHSGTITVESQQGVGTTFLIRIPISGEAEQNGDEHLDH